jgi:RNA polymerase subunit RPABC4/transcription elongation factor Spt4
MATTYGTCRKCGRLTYIEDGYCKACQDYSHASGVSSHCQNCGKPIYGLGKYCPACKQYLKASGKISPFD